MKSIDIIIGGQFGSEGKGKVAFYLGKRTQHKCIARIGGANSGHTANNCILQHLPVSVLFNGKAIIGAGSYLRVDILLKEISKFTPSTLYIDSKAVIISQTEPLELQTSIGSTLSGTGEGVLARIKRAFNCKFVTSIPQLSKYIKTSAEIHSIIEAARGCIIEGTQGFGLSLIHSPYYPYVTSRDTTAAGCISEMGISPKRVRNIYLVIRAFPIRVGGNSGPLYKECSWDSIGVKAEMTSITKRIRRVGLFEPEIVRQAIRYSSPTHIVLNHLDYIEKAARFKFVSSIEEAIGQKVDYIGLGPNNLTPC